MVAAGGGADGAPGEISAPGSISERRRRVRESVSAAKAIGKQRCRRVDAALPSSYGRRRKRRARHHRDRFTPGHVRLDGYDWTVSVTPLSRKNGSPSAVVGISMRRVCSVRFKSLLSRVPPTRRNGRTTDDRRIRRSKRD